MTVRLGVDFGTSTTVAVLERPGGETTSLLFDGSPLLPSAVFAPVVGDLLVGQDALRGARMAPARFEPNPKQRISEDSVLLGDREVPVADLVAAVLSRVAVEARRVSGRVDEVTMTVPAAWGGPRRAVLEAAAARAGLPRPDFVPEPVAAAAHFSGGDAIRPGTSAVVYDFGAGTFDATVVRRHSDGFDVLATAGLPDVGGLDVDAAILAYLGGVYGSRDAEAWIRLTEPRTDADRRAVRQVWDDIRGAKELLARAPSAFIPLPSLGVDAPLGREQLDELTGPLLVRTVQTTLAAIRSAGVTVDAVLLVGGSSRMPAIATRLHRATGVAPTVTEWPELVVALGALHAPVQTSPADHGRPQPAARHRPGSDRPDRDGMGDGRTPHDWASVADPAAPDPPPAGLVTRDRLSWRRPAVLGAATIGSAAVAAVAAGRATREALVVGLLAPVNRTLFPLLAAAVLVLGASRFRRRRLFAPLPGDPPLPLMVAGAALAAAVGWTVVQAAQAATLSLGFVTPAVPLRLLVERAGPLSYATLAVGLAAAGIGVWLVAGAIPADPLEPPADGQDAGRRFVAAAVAGGVLALGAHTHLYGNRLDKATGAVVTARAVDDPVLFLARTFSQPGTEPLGQLAMAGAYLLGVAFTMWLLGLAAAGIRRLAAAEDLARRAAGSARYIAGTGAGLLAVAGSYLAYHAFREIGFWSARRQDTGRGTAPQPVDDPVLHAGDWLWTTAGPVCAAVAIGLAVIALRPRRWPWSPGR